MFKAKQREEKPILYQTATDMADAICIAIDAILHFYIIQFKWWTHSRLCYINTVNAVWNISNKTNV